MKNIDRFQPPNILIEMFCRESNGIESIAEGKLNPWEVYNGHLNPADIGICRNVLAFAHNNKPLNEAILLDFHKKFCQDLGVDWAGKYRSVELISPPNTVKAGLVPHVIHNFMLDWPTLNAWEAYHRFERIHPFVDRNGRVGRVLWLWKALQEGWNWQHGFLQEYHYQTLRNIKR